MSPERVKPKSESLEAARWSLKGLVPWAILILFAVLWIGFFALTSPQLAGPDVFVFRDAGCNWAHGLGLVAASVPHANTARPMLFASYTPGALLLFGLVASIFGCSAPVDTFYNVALATAAVFLIYRCFSLAVTSGRQRICAALLLGAMLPTGMVAFDPDRPEMPAFCLLVAILLLWRYATSDSGRWLLFASTGLVFLIHPFAGIVGWLLLAFLLVFGERPIPPISTTRRLQIVITGTPLCVLIVAAWGLTLWLQDHSAVHRFLNHAAGQGTGAGVVLHGAKTAGSESTPRTHNGYAFAFRELFNPAFPSSAALAISLLASGLVVALCAWRGRQRLRLLVECAFLLFVLVAFPFAVFPAQTNYLGLSRAVLLVILLIGGFPLATALRGSRVLLSLMLIAFVFTAPWIGLEVVQNAEVRASYHQEQAQARRAQSYFERRGIHNPPLIVDSGHYFLYKPYFSNLYNPNYLEPGDATERFQGFIRCFSGSRAFSREQLPWNDAIDRERWQLIDEGEDAVRVTLFGRPIMRRNWTWLCDVYARQ